MRIRRKCANNLSLWVILDLLNADLMEIWAKLKFSGNFNADLSKLRVKLKFSFHFK